MSVLLAQAGKRQMPIIVAATPLVLLLAGFPE